MSYLCDIVIFVMATQGSNNPYNNPLRYEAQTTASLGSALVALQLVLCLMNDTSVLPMSGAFVRGITLLGSAVTIYVVMGVRHFAAVRGIRGPYSVWVAAMVLGFVMQAFSCLLPLARVMLMQSFAGTVVWIGLVVAVQLVWVVSLVCLGYGLYKQRHDFYGDLFLSIGIAWTLCMAVQLASLVGLLGMSSVTLQGGFQQVFSFAGALCFVALFLLLRRTD